MHANPKKFMLILWSVGVLFTRHPVTLNPGVMMINANYGLGEVSENQYCVSNNNNNNNK